MKTAAPRPYWDQVDLPQFAPVRRSLDVDVVVIGAGLTGITTAWLLKEAGRRVALVERGRVGGVDTGCTTAHLATVTDARLDSLCSTLGRDHGQAVWDAGWAAIHEIERLIELHQIECDFTWVPGYLHVARDADAATREREADRLREEARLANELEFDAEYVDAAPLVGMPAMRVDHQAKFHPRKYLHALLRRIPGDGCEIFGDSEAMVSDTGVDVGGHTISAQWVVMATHNPLQGRQGFLAASLLQTKLALYTSYVVRARLRDAQDEALYWDTATPYHYLRIDKVGGETFAIAGGADHKTGQASDPDASYAEVQRWLKRVAPTAEVTERWSGQVIETPDLLPIIGTVADRQFVATGFAGNGMTFGTLAAMMARDRIVGRMNPWQSLFDAGRSIATRGPWKYLTENIDYPYYMIRDRFAGHSGRTLRSIQRSTGAIVEVGGKTVAAYRSERGKLTTLSATCTHLGCRVEWNGTEGTWDCPCHGSRFHPTGEVLAGPAEKALEPIDTHASESSRAAEKSSSRAS